jgi:hypothetical protein
MPPTHITNLTGADAMTALNANGIASDQIPAKIEGLAFGQDIDVNGMLEHTLFFSNDNDVVADVAGPNQFFVFGFTSGSGCCIALPRRAPASLPRR